jgi:hypothetical protein
VHEKLTGKNQLKALQQLKKWPCRQHMENQIARET